MDKITHSLFIPDQFSHCFNCVQSIYILIWTSYLFVGLRLMVHNKLGSLILLNLCCMSLLSFIFLSVTKLPNLYKRLSKISRASHLGHRTLYVGVRMPRQSHRHHKAHSSRHRRRERRAGSTATQQSEESETTSSHGNTNPNTQPRADLYSNQRRPFWIECA